MEEVYQEALEIELSSKNIPFISQQNLQIQYKGKPLQHSYKPDLICYNQIIVELKAVSILIKEHEAQLHNYLKATGFRLGFLANFGHYPKLELKRIV